MPTARTTVHSAATTMATTDLVHFASIERALRPADQLPAIALSYHQLVAPVRSAIVRARRMLLREMRDDGSWLGNQHGNASLPSQFVLLLAYLGQEETELACWAANAILLDQAADGGWPATPRGPSELSVSVQAYFALKLAGQKPNRPHMAAARQVIRSLGGADRTNVTTRQFLALFGQIEPGCDLNLDLPLRPIDLSRGVRELFIAPPAQWPPADEDPRPGDSSFAKFVWKVISTNSPVGDEPPTISADDEDRLQQFISVDEEREVGRPSLAMSAVLDTAIVREALLQSGLRLGHLQLDRGNHWPRARGMDTLELAARLRLAAACHRSDDAASLLPPDIQMLGDRTSAKRAARQNEDVADFDAQQQVTEELAELFLRQNCDGGWSSNHASNAGSDSDVTGAVLESLSLHGVESMHSAIRRGAEYLRSTQRADGSWDSATGVRFVHGTSLAVRGLIAAGVALDDPAIAAGANWLLVHQQEIGGWGEAAPTSDAHDEFVPAAASAIQTAWAVSALVAAGLATDDATHLGVQFLLETQEDDDDWRDTQFTLRDSDAAAFYRNDLRTTATTLAAIAEWVTAAAKEQTTLTPACLKLVVS
jgi:Squalene-hopene cyclase N-terminal domain/Squalene-hopene cyclase C-terminal domain